MVTTTTTTTTIRMLTKGVARVGTATATSTSTAAAVRVSSEGAAASAKTAATRTAQRQHQQHYHRSFTTAHSNNNNAGATAIIRSSSSSSSSSSNNSGGCAINRPLQSFPHPQQPFHQQQHALLLKQQLQQRSWFSSSSSEFSSYEYPHATEKPTVSRTTAKEALAQEAASASASASAPTTTDNNNKAATSTAAVSDNDDPFDDRGMLSAIERDRIRQEQRTSLVETRHLSQAQTALGPISTIVPSLIPPNVPSDELRAPPTELTTLSNGLRVVSQETYGQVSTVGVCCQVGSRQERQDQNEQGVVNLLEMVAFGATDQYTGQQVTESLLSWGGTRFGTTGREQSLYCIDLLRPNVDKAVGLLASCLLEPKFLQEELDEATQALSFQALEMPTELSLGEALQSAAYGGSTQQLGQPHFCSNLASVEAIREQISPADLHAFWHRQFLSNPEQIVVGGAGVSHEQLVALAERHFGHLEQVDDVTAGRTVITDSVYRGGQELVIPPPVPRGEDIMNGAAMEEDNQLTRVALALEVGGWHSPDLVSVCVLQTLLGGGNAFSAGGPGKGMYSRLYRQVLNQYHWAESTEAFTAFANESGLVGISGSIKDQSKTRDMTIVLADHLGRLAVEPVSDEELDRARNMLKCNVLIQLESRLVLFEDLARQVLTYGMREDMHTTCARIEAVTKSDVQQLAIKALQKPPTVAAVGADLSGMPSHDEIAGWFRGMVN